MSTDKAILRQLARYLHKSSALDAIYDNDADANRAEELVEWFVDAVEVLNVPQAEEGTTDGG